MIILNNIYNDEETTIKDNEYVNKTLMSKFDYNKQFENNINKKDLGNIQKGLEFTSDISVLGFKDKQVGGSEFYFVNNNSEEVILNKHSVKI